MMQIVIKVDLSGQGQNLPKGSASGGELPTHGSLPVSPSWWTGAESNCRHTAFQAVALPTELPVQILLKLANGVLLTSL